MVKFFRRFGAADNVEDMLRRGATLSHQINVLLNVVADGLSVKRFPDDIRGVLNRLREARNDIAHRGTPKKPQTQRAAAEHLVAAVFLVKYAELLEQKLAGGQVSASS